MKRILLVCSLLLLVGLGVWSIAAAQDGQRPVFLGVVVTEAENGALVETVQPGSPADEAGVRAGDIIVEVDGQAVTAASIRQQIAKQTAGDTVTMSVLRGGETIDLAVTLAARPQRPQPGPQFDRAFPEQPRLGVRLDDTDEGVVIREVVSDSAAAQAGLEVGDILKKVGEIPIENARAVVEAVLAQEIGDTLVIEIERDGQTETVNVTLGAAPNRPFQQGMEQLFSLVYDPLEKTWSIGAISEGNSLYEAGLREGDVITQFEGKAYDPAELRAYLRGLTDVTEVTLTVQRDGEEQEITVPLEALSNLGLFGGPQGQMFNMPFGERLPGARLGVEFLTIDEQIAQERNLSESEGALVTQVMADTPAAEAGLQENDIILAVNGDQLDAERTLRDRLAAYEPGDTVKLDVKRDTESLELEVTLDQLTPDRFAPFFNRDGFQFRFLPDFKFQIPPEWQQKPVPDSPNI